MSQYRVELLNPVEDDPCSLGLFATRHAARVRLQEEWTGWLGLVSQEGFPHSLSRLSQDRFTVRTPSGQAIVYRIAGEAAAKSSPVNGRRPRGNRRGASEKAQRGRRRASH